MADMTGSFKDYRKHLGAVVRNIPAMKSGMLNMFGSDVAEDARDNIIGRTSTPDFPNWAPLKDSTIFRKTLAGQGKNGDPNSMLYATGKLADSIKFKITIPGKEVCVGTNVVYAEDHEYGSISRNIPARPFLAPAAIRQIKRLIGVFETVQCATIEGDRPYRRR